MAVGAHDQRADLSIRRLDAQHLGRMDRGCQGMSLGAIIVAVKVINRAGRSADSKLLVLVDRGDVNAPIAAHAQQTRTTATHA